MEDPDSWSSDAPDAADTRGVTHFDEIAHEYDASIPAHVMDHYVSRRAALLSGLLTDETTAAVLEVGCGTGVLLDRMDSSDRSCFGLDPSAGMLAVAARDHREGARVAGSGEALPFTDGAFDLVYCVAVLHHVIEPEAVHRVIGEMVRVCRVGGHVVIWDHNPRNPYWPYLMRRVPQDHGDERLVPEREILDAIRDAGATVVASKQLGLVPDFAPRRLLRAAQVTEAAVERVPGLRRLCAHNVVIAQR